MTDPVREQLAQQIEGARFAEVRLRMGYDIAEVDQFLRESAAKVRAGDPPEGLIVATEGVRFTAVRLRAGYDMSDVDTALDEIVAGLRRLPVEPVEPLSSSSPVSPSGTPLPSVVVESQGAVTRLRRRLGGKG